MKDREQQIREAVSDIKAWSEVFGLRRLAERTAEAFNRHNGELRDELRALIAGEHFDGPK
jgi:hypothetical protein